MRAVEMEKAGWPAFPSKDHHGMTLRDYFAAHAPIEYAQASYLFGGQIPHEDVGLAVFMAVWAHLRYEYADAMLKERES